MYGLSELISMSVSLRVQLINKKLLSSLACNVTSVFQVRSTRLVGIVETLPPCPASTMIVQFGKVGGGGGGCPILFIAAW